MYFTNTEYHPVRTLNSLSREVIANHCVTAVLTGGIAAKNLKTGSLRGQTAVFIFLIGGRTFQPV